MGGRQRRTEVRKGKRVKEVKPDERKRLACERFKGVRANSHTGFVYHRLTVVVLNY